MLTAEKHAAKEVAESLGHILGRFMNDRETGQAYAQCKICGLGVLVKPNTYLVAGATATHCISTTDAESEAS